MYIISKAAHNNSVQKKIKIKNQKSNAKTGGIIL
mgnify:CR=1 FL=1